MGTIIAAMTPDERCGPEVVLRLLGGSALALGLMLDVEATVPELPGSASRVGVGKGRVNAGAFDN